MMWKLPWLFVLVLLPTALRAQVQPDTLYINAGVIVDSLADDIPVKRLNATSAFETRGAILHVSPNQAEAVIVVNNAQQPHVLVVAGQQTEVTIPAESTVRWQLPALPAGLYHLREKNPDQSYLGLTAMLHVAEQGQQHFYWHLHEYQSTWNEAILNGGSPNRSQYVPDHFTINGLSFPYTTRDAAALVTGQVGDTLYINILNSGQMAHALHFHGYHCRIVRSSAFPHHAGRMKDTFPVLAGETLELELVPHQPGDFPVHDHNLQAVTVGGNYPGGMITMLKISE